jgi:hypothetical protein
MPAAASPARAMLLCTRASTISLLRRFSGWSRSRKTRIKSAFKVAPLYIIVVDAIAGCCGQTQRAWLGIGALMKPNERSQGQGTRLMSPRVRPSIVKLRNGCLDKISQRQTESIINLEWTP